MDSLQLGRGDLVRISQKIKEGKRERIVSFTGKLISLRGKDENQMLTIRQMVDGVWVDRIIPKFAPVIAKIELIEDYSKRSLHSAGSRRKKVVAASTKKPARKKKKS